MTTPHETFAKALTEFTEIEMNALTLDDNGTVLWQIGTEKHPVAQLSKGQNLYTPKITVTADSGFNAEQKKVFAQHIDEWFTFYKKKTLGPLLDLEKNEAKGMAQGIAVQLYEHGGVMLRSDVQKLLALMEKDERKILGNLGIKLGAYYLYHRDTLKPAAMHTKAVLWRLYNNLMPEFNKLPQAGNVSMAFPENGDQTFYRTIGLPVFGKTCVRVDMVERLNSAIFDGAVEGKYAFDPALASTVGVSVDTVHAILHDLGFRFDDVTEGEGEAAVTKRFYHVKKRAPKLEEKPKVDRAPRPKPKHNKPKTFEKKKEEPKVHKPTGYNPFEALAALKKSN